jgi:hypothetical protein
MPKLSDRVLGGNPGGSLPSYFGKNRAGKPVEEMELGT